MQQSTIQQNLAPGQGVKSVLEGIRSEIRQNLFNLTVSDLEKDPGGRQKLLNYIDNAALYDQYRSDLDIRGLLTLIKAFQDIEDRLVPELSRPELSSDSENSFNFSEDKKIQAYLTVLDGIKDLKDKSNLLSNLIIITSFAVAVVGITLVVGVSIPALPILTPAIGIGLILAAVIGALVVLGQRSSQNNIFSSWMQGLGKGTSDRVTNIKDTLVDFAQEYKRLPNTVNEYRSFASGGAIPLNGSPKAAASANIYSKEGTALAPGARPSTQEDDGQLGQSSGLK
tara:strand:- start:1691 stop:2539 length:849 start_codon:yes stop_codon:yes gene_type:complete